MDYHRLTRILIRVLGVWLIAQGIAGVLSGLLNLPAASSLPHAWASFWILPAHAAIGLLVGTGLILFSYRLANTLSE